jgi:hypothetical protein
MFMTGRVLSPVPIVMDTHIRQQSRHAYTEEIPTEFHTHRFCSRISVVKILSRADSMLKTGDAVVNRVVPAATGLGHVIVMPELRALADCVYNHAVRQ